MSGCWLSGLLPPLFGDVMNESLQDRNESEITRGYPLLHVFLTYMLDVVQSLLACEGTEGMGATPLFGDVTNESQQESCNN